MAKRKSSYTPRQQAVIDKGDEVRATKEAAEALKRAALAAGSFSEKLRYAYLPSLANKVNNAPGKIVNKAWDTLTATVRSVIAPLTALAAVAAVLGSPSSGFGVLIKAVQVAASAIAPILLPVFALLAAAMLTVSEIFWEKLAPNLESWYMLILGTAIPATLKLIQAFSDAADFLFRMANMPGGTLAEWIEKNTWIGRQGGAAGEAIGNWIEGGFRNPSQKTPGVDTAPWEAGKKAYNDAKARGASEEEANKASSDAVGKAGGKVNLGGPLSGAGRIESGGDAKAALLGGLGAVPPDDAKNPFKRFMKNLRMFSQELRQSSGPQPSFMGLAQANRSAQLAALGSSPFERIMLERMQTVLEEFEKVIGAIERQNMGAN